MTHNGETAAASAKLLAGEPSAIADALIPYRPADAVEALNSLDRAQAARVIEAMPVDQATQLFDQSHLDQPAKLIEQIPRDRAVSILSGMHPDRRADIFRGLPRSTRQLLSAHLATPVREAIEQLLRYPPQSAGAIMTTEFVTVPTNWTVEQALRFVREVGKTQETVYAVCLLDPETKRLLKVISLSQLVISDPKASVLSAARPYRPIMVSPLTDREEVARLISKYDLLAVPVVGENGHVLGIVTVDDVIDAIIAEDTEDVQKIGGSEAFDEPYLKIGFTTMVRKRAGYVPCSSRRC
jgi:magnesium transporter